MHLDIPGPPLLSSTLQTNTAGQQPPSQSPSPQPQAAALDYSAMFGSLSSPRLPQQSAPATPSLGPPHTTPQINNDEEWAFTSALPPGSAAKPNEMLVVDSNLRVVVEVNRPVPDGPILLKATFSNNASQVIQDLTFQMAVTKVCFLGYPFNILV